MEYIMSYFGKACYSKPFVTYTFSFMRNICVLNAQIDEHYVQRIANKLMHEISLAKRLIQSDI